jgi:hypothetical protein
MTGLDRAQRVFPDCFTVAESGCWEWTRGKLPQGYGAADYRARLIRTAQQVSPRLLAAKNADTA